MTITAQDALKALIEEAQAFVDRKYVARADSRQKAMGLAYVTAERADLAIEIAKFVRTYIKRNSAPTTREQIAQIIAPHSIAAVSLHGENASDQAIAEADEAFAKADDVIALSTPPAEPVGYVEASSLRDIITAKISGVIFRREKRRGDDIPLYTVPSDAMALAEKLAEALQIAHTHASCALYAEALSDFAAAKGWKP